MRLKKYISVTIGKFLNSLCFCLTTFGFCLVWFMSFAQSVECQIFLIVIFFNCSQVLQFGAHSRCYKGALTQKHFQLSHALRSDFHVSRKNENKHSTLNLSFKALSK